MKKDLIPQILLIFLNLFTIFYLKEREVVSLVSVFSKI